MRTSAASSLDGSEPDASGEAVGATGAASPARRDALVFALLVAVTLLPLAVALVSLVGATWHPIGDAAIELLRIGEVGTRDTPLVGQYSRFGWDHPGPMLFYVLAPFRALFGDAGVLFGVGVLNGAAMAGTLAVARRRGGLALAAITSVVLLLLVVGLGTDLLVDPWNPWVAITPFLLFVFLAWSVVEGDTVALPWMAFVGSWAVQAHAGYAPLVAGLGLLAVAWVVTARRAQPRLARHSVAAVGVALACWASPLWDQLFGSGNLGEILSYARHPEESPFGWALAYGVFGVQLGPGAPWVTGDDVNAAGTVATGSTWLAVLTTAAVVALGALAAARGARPAGRFAGVVASAVALAIFATSRVSGLTGSYVVRYWWVVAAVCWCSIAWSSWCLLSSRRPSFGRALGAALGFGAAALSASLAVAAVPASVPEEALSDQAGVLARAVARELDPGGRYLVLWVDRRHLGSVGVGVFYELHERGFDLVVHPDYSGAIGERYDGRDVPVDGTIFVVVRDVLEAGWLPPDGARLVATAEPLTPAQLRRMAELDRAIRADVPEGLPAGPLRVDFEADRRALVAQGADPAKVRELADLRGAVSGHAVYFVPAPGPAAGYS
jgi:hypothetical protein